MKTETKEPEKKEEKESRPTWYAIKEYYEIVRKYMESISTSIINGDNETHLRSLKGLYIQIRPYIKSDNAKKINDNIIKARNYSHLARREQKIYELQQRLLEEATEDLFVAAKNIMLPTVEEDDEDREFNPWDAI